MTPLPCRSVSPLPSWASRPGVIPTRRVPSFGESLKSIWTWLRGGERSTLRQMFAEQRVVERLAEELAEADAAVVIDEDRKAGRLAKPPGVSKDRVRKRPDLPTLADQGVDKHLADHARIERDA
jgi:hypothetical protein